MHRQAKIICTLGPATSSYDQVVQLIRAGMNVARLNFSHGSQQEHLKTIQTIKKARKECEMPVAIMLDTRGPEIRVGRFAEGKMIITQGQEIHLVAHATGTFPLEIEVHPAEILPSLKPKMRILFDDGHIEAEVLENVQNSVVIRFKKDSILFSRKGINIPGLSTGIPLVTEQDREDILFGCHAGIDLIAASFICEKGQIDEIRALVKKAGREEIPILAKIENELGLQNFDAILEASDGIMVARGDLGVETPLERVPLLQKMMVEEGLKAFKPIIIATQMLESMIHSPRPTRAEVSDVASATYQMATALMLSAETATGRYPIEAVTTMARTIAETESTIDYHLAFHASHKKLSSDIAHATAIAAVKLTMTSGQFKALVACTTSGITAKMLSTLRPKVPIIAVTQHEHLYHQMAFLWGVIPLLHATSCVDEAILAAQNEAQKRGILSKEGVVVACYGVPWGVPGTTNSIRSVRLNG